MKREIVLNIFWILLLMIGIVIAFTISRKPYETLIFLFSYESLVYMLIKGIENNIYSNKTRKILILEPCDEDELLQYRLNTKLKNLNKQGFTVADVKIIPIKKFTKVFYKAYIIYY
ncbi:hypothetical protein AGE29_01670 [Clostridium botulinum]|uniref:Uncharacterized protein n=1 Tax=Clostridium botulinum (strain 657 / Type Ba4) TaxID=515621 RepID=A0A3F2ZTZ3_CLOB6|nr:hypothetical protein [Clostridium botulinum]ACQ52308.1 hypothetical protein CLJ_B2511 [Clostridium botulinum Ba4 str. 657]AXG90549.1 hypothetical protein AGE29_01670 [Clostridium botulinum]RFM20588.1 hypothetical protein C1146_16725 [Clostridium botulinum]